MADGGVTLRVENITPANWRERLGETAIEAAMEGLMKGGLEVNRQARQNVQDLPGTIRPHIAAPHILSGHLRRSITTERADDDSGVFVGVAIPGTPADSRGNAGSGEDAGTPNAAETARGEAEAKKRGIKFMPTPASKYGPRVERSVHMIERALETKRQTVITATVSAIRRAIKRLER